MVEVMSRTHQIEHRTLYSAIFRVLVEGVHRFVPRWELLFRLEIPAMGVMEQAKARIGGRGVVEVVEIVETHGENESEGGGLGLRLGV